MQRFCKHHLHAHVHIRQLLNSFGIKHLEMDDRCHILFILTGYALSAGLQMKLSWRRACLELHARAVWIFDAVQVFDCSSCRLGAGVLHIAESLHASVGAQTHALLEDLQYEMTCKCELRSLRAKSMRHSCHICRLHISFPLLRHETTFSITHQASGDVRKAHMQACAWCMSA